MSDPIRLTIRGHGAETDAPTVEDLLAQIGDWMVILCGVEEAIIEDGSPEIEWRLRSRAERPRYFTDPVLEKSEELFRRVT